MQTRRPFRETRLVDEYTDDDPSSRVNRLIRLLRADYPMPFIEENPIQTFEEPICPRPGIKARLRSLIQRLIDRAALVTSPPRVDSIDLNVRPSDVERPPVTLAASRRSNISKCSYDAGDWVIDPHGYYYFFWLFCVSLCYIYNLIVIPLRSTFPYQTPENSSYWLMFDYFCDVFYVIDTFLIKPRVSFLEEGSWVQDSKKTTSNYRQKTMFKLDMASLLPLEILYIKFGTNATLLRFPRILKWQTFSQFTTSIDKRLSSPLIIRVARTLIYTFYMIHLNACAYYKASDIEGIGYNGWTYNGEGNAYIRCFYFATKTSTSIGKNAKPENDFEYIYMTFAWLTGVCVFALLVGQIRYFIIMATKAQTEYRILLAETLKCMRELNIPCNLQKRVKLWFEFTWKQQRTLDDSRALNTLPINLMTEVAMNMHIKTLSKVKLFTDCEPALLRDLVLKLRSVIYLPGDVICRKGDVGKEMYIVKRGDVEVIGGLNNNEILATLSEGSVFGEISLLNINGVNRRTADVRAHLFSNVFVLSKLDFDSVLQYYPEAQKLLLKRASDLMRANAAREKVHDEEYLTTITGPDEELEEEDPALHRPTIIYEVNGNEVTELHRTNVHDFDTHINRQPPPLPTRLPPEPALSTAIEENIASIFRRDIANCCSARYRTRRRISMIKRGRKKYNLYRTIASKEDQPEVGCHSRDHEKLE